jgi:predicted house-cleaning noncanonical NTP pyrophosphatase (MazG superfamily)
MDTIEKAIEFENRKFSFKTTSDRILAAREAKDLILEVNEIYKDKKDAKLMDLMKRLTIIKQKIEKRLKGRPLTAT